MAKRQSKFNAMDKQCADLIKEVEQHRESLADFNTVLDKVGWGLQVAHLLLFAILQVWVGKA